MSWAAGTSTYISSPAAFTFDLTKSVYPCTTSAGPFYTRWGMRAVTRRTIRSTPPGPRRRPPPSSVDASHPHGRTTDISAAQCPSTQEATCGTTGRCCCRKFILGVTFIPAWRSSGHFVTIVSPSRHAAFDSSFSPVNSKFEPDSDRTYTTAVRRQLAKFDLSA